jgi:branched-chain amino acid transport system ATP-binding protein
MSPQGDAIFPGLTVEQHLDCGAYKKESWKNRSQKKEQIYEIFPPLEKLKKSLVGKLSGGERRMVSIGRMLMEEANLYLVDEPSLGLAPKISENVIKALLKVDIKNSAMIIAEQNVSLLKGNVERMVGMHAGRLRGDVGHISLG